uniref:Uncharacterized protein n=1 Tax=Chromera velia CCMP2878 TaxID=1169474 RepID=A0A0G4HJE0_9ALVE|eukprot:Cvel_7078.t1-p1 / transcript=Cvel_7078.t1 / gene=Cvel_7078 / organism=Chromera_velia_CCMP2878 / gene_product=hypothetical protein / transcript_product=hypothetical protein / location=Cvel_scaffold362:22984-24384(-) / protein_length=467 / sequence_SO=supercontig / SO=protein_coding / is_pseudo=false
MHMQPREEEDPLLDDQLLGEDVWEGDQALGQNQANPPGLETFDEGVQFLTDALREGRLPKMESIELDMWCGDVSPAVLSGLGRALGSNLRSLDLTWDSPRESTTAGLEGLAESLSEGRLHSLEHLRLKPGGTSTNTGGSFVLGEVLNTGKAPSLRRVELVWPLNETLVSLCDGFSAGCSPSSDLRLDFEINVAEADWNHEEVYQAAFDRLVQTIRGGGMRFLHKFDFGKIPFLDPERSEKAGEALTHAGAFLNLLTEITFPPLQSYFPQQTPQTVPRHITKFLEGMCRGSGRLPSLRLLSRDSYFNAFSPHLGLMEQMDTETMRPFFSLVSGGKLPSLRHLNVQLSRHAKEVSDVQALTAALCTPHVSALRRLQVSMPRMSPDTPTDQLILGMFSVALAAEYLGNLEELRVDGFALGLGGRGLFDGLGSGKISSLRTLELFGQTGCAVRSRPSELLSSSDKQGVQSD